MARTVSGRIVGVPATLKLGVVNRLLGPPGSIVRSRHLYLLLVFAPVISLFLIIRAIPITAVLALAFTNYNMVRPDRLRFVGIDNFPEMLQDPTLGTALQNSFSFVVFSVPAVVILAFTFAELINRRIRCEGLFQTLYFLPFILPTVPTAIIWRWIYAPGQFGLANGLLQKVGLPTVPWLTQTEWAIFAIMAMYIWSHVGLYVVFFLVGLKSISQELREAALVDGGTPWQIVRFIDIPLMRPIFLYAIVMGTIQAWAIFTEVYVMTQGTDVSAGISLPVVALRIYQEGFIFYKMGYASAISFLLFVVSLVFIILQLRFLQPKD